MPHTAKSTTVLRSREKPRTGLTGDWVAARPEPLPHLDLLVCSQSVCFWWHSLTSYRIEDEMLVSMAPACMTPVMDEDLEPMNAV